MAKLPSAKVYSLSVSVSYPGQLGATLGPRTLPVNVCKVKEKIGTSLFMSGICVFVPVFLLEVNRANPVFNLYF